MNFDTSEYRMVLKGLIILRLKRLLVAQPDGKRVCKRIPRYKMGPGVDHHSEYHYYEIL